MLRVLAIAALLSLLFASSGCGQKRALYLPDQPEVDASAKKETQP